MEGGTFLNSGVSLISGSGLLPGDSVTLYCGARSWRIRIPSTKYSVENVFSFRVQGWSEMGSSQQLLFHLLRDIPMDGNKFHRK